jgi:hypothetical protein
MDRSIQSVTVGIPGSDVAKVTACYQELLDSREEIDTFPGVKEFEFFHGYWLQLLENEKKSVLSASSVLESLTSSVSMT